MKREGDYIKHPPPTLYIVESFSFVNTLACVFSVSIYILCLSLSHTHTYIYTRTVLSIPLHRIISTRFFTMIIHDLFCPHIGFNDQYGCLHIFLHYFYGKLSSVLNTFVPWVFANEYQWCTLGGLTVKGWYLLVRSPYKYIVSSCNDIIILVIT